MRPRDVSPVTKEVSTRKGGGFLDPGDLTLMEKLVRRQVAERAVWPALVVVDPPRSDLRLGVDDRREPVYIQAFISQAPIKRFDERDFKAVCPDE